MLFKVQIFWLNLKNLSNIKNFFPKILNIGQNTIFFLFVVFIDCHYKITKYNCYNSTKQWRQQIHITKTLKKNKIWKKTKTNAKLLGKLNKSVTFLLKAIKLLLNYINALINFSHFWKCARSLFFSLEIWCSILYTLLVLAINPSSVGKLVRHLLQ